MAACQNSIETLNNLLSLIWEALQFFKVDFVKYLITEWTFNNRHNKSSLNQIKLQAIWFKNLLKLYI